MYVYIYILYVYIYTYILYVCIYIYICIYIYYIYYYVYVYLDIYIYTHEFPKFSELPPWGLVWSTMRIPTHVFATSVRRISSFGEEIWPMFGVILIVKMVVNIWNIWIIFEQYWNYLVLFKNMVNILDLILFIQRKINPNSFGLNMYQLLSSGHLWVQDFLSGDWLALGVLNVGMDETTGETYQPSSWVVPQRVARSSLSRFVP